MLCYEEPEARTLWLAKATPRGWLVAGEAPLVAERLTTRYGRVAFNLTVVAPEGAAYAVHASVVLPASVAVAPPPGGLRLRLRAPSEYAGRLSAVTVGGVRWSAFSAAEETVDFAASALTASLVRDGLPRIVATFGSASPVPLQRAKTESSFDLSQVPAVRASASTSPTTPSLVSPQSRPQ